MTREVLEPYLAGLTSTQRGNLIKKLMVYSQRYAKRRYANSCNFSETGEDIAAETVRRIMEGRDGYALRSEEQAMFAYLCRCARQTTASFQRKYESDKHRVNARTLTDPERDGAAVSDEFTESAAAELLDRLERLAEFEGYLKRLPQRGKQERYAERFVKYAERAWSTAQIADELGITQAEVRSYRSRLREAVQEFVAMLARREDPSSIAAGETSAGTRGVGAGLGSGPAPARLPGKPKKKD